MTESKRVGLLLDYAIETLTSKSNVLVDHVKRIVDSGITSEKDRVLLQHFPTLAILVSVLRDEQVIPVDLTSPLLADHADLVAAYRRMVQDHRLMETFFPSLQASRKRLWMREKGMSFYDICRECGCTIENVSLETLSLAVNEDTVFEVLVFLVHRILDALERGNVRSVVDDLLLLRYFGSFDSAQGHLFALVVFSLGHLSSWSYKNAKVKMLLPSFIALLQSIDRQDATTLAERLQALISHDSSCEVSAEACALAIHDRFDDACALIRFFVENEFHISDEPSDSFPMNVVHSAGVPALAQHGSPDSPLAQLLLGSPKNESQEDGSLSLPAVPAAGVVTVEFVASEMVKYGLFSETHMAEAMSALRTILAEAESVAIQLCSDVASSLASPDDPSSVDAFWWRIILACKTANNGSSEDIVQMVQSIVDEKTLFGVLLAVDLGQLSNDQLIAIFTPLQQKPMFTKLWQLVADAYALGEDRLIDERIPHSGFSRGFEILFLADQMYATLFRHYIAQGRSALRLFDYACKRGLERLLGPKGLQLALEEAVSIDADPSMLGRLVSLLHDSVPADSRASMASLGALSLGDIVAVARLGGPAYQPVMYFAADLINSGIAAANAQVPQKLIFDPLFFCDVARVSSSRLDNSSAADIDFICSELVMDDAVRQLCSTVLTRGQPAAKATPSRLLSPYKRSVRPRSFSSNSRSVVSMSESASSENDVLHSKTMNTFVYTSLRDRRPNLLFPLSAEQLDSLLGFLLRLSDVSPEVSAWITAHMEVLTEERPHTPKVSFFEDLSHFSDFKASSSTMYIIFLIALRMSWSRLALVAVVLFASKSTDDVERRLLQVLLSCPKHFRDFFCSDMDILLKDIAAEYAKGFLHHLLRKRFHVAFTGTVLIATQTVASLKLQRVTSPTVQVSVLLTLCFGDPVQTSQLLFSGLADVASYATLHQSDAFGSTSEARTLLNAFRAACVFSFEALCILYQMAGTAHSARAYRLLELFTELCFVNPVLAWKFSSLLIKEERNVLLSFRDELSIRGHLKLAEAVATLAGPERGAPATMGSSANSKETDMQKIVQYLTSQAPLSFEDRGAILRQFAKALWLPEEIFDVCGILAASTSASFVDSLAAMRLDHEMSLSDLFLECLLRLCYIRAALDFCPDWNKVTLACIRCSTVPALFAECKNRLSSVDAGSERTAVKNLIQGYICPVLRQHCFHRFACSFHVLCEDVDAALTCGIDGLTYASSLAEQIDWVAKLKTWGADPLLCDIETKLMQMIGASGEAQKNRPDLPLWHVEDFCREKKRRPLRCTLFGSIVEKCRVAESVVMLGDYATAVRLMHALRLPADVYRRCAIYFIRQEQYSRFQELLTEMKGLFDNDDWDSVLTACIHALALEKGEMKVAEKLCTKIIDPSRQIICCLVCEKYKAACLLAVENGRTEDVMLVRQQADAKGLKSVVQVCDKYLQKHNVR